MNGFIKSKRLDLIYSFFLFVVCAFFYFDFTAMPLTNDHVFTFFPLFNSQSLGNISAWDPYMAAGNPVCYNIQNSFCYPLRWIFFFFSGPFVYSCFFALHYYLAFILTYYGLRMLRIFPKYAFVGALLYGLSGGIQGKFINPIILMSMVWLPFITAWIVRCFSDEAKPRAAWITALLLGMMIHIGNVHTTFYSFLILWLYGLMCIAESFYDKEKVKRYILQLFQITFFAGLLGIPALLSLIKLVPLSIRAMVQDSFIFDNQTAPKELLFTLIGGLSNPENLDKTIFMGLPSLFALSFGLIHFKKYWKWMVLIIMGLLLCLGNRGLYYFFPFFPVLKSIINPSRASMVTLTSFVFLFTFSLQKMAQMKNRRNVILLWLALSGCSMVTAFFTFRISLFFLMMTGAVSLVSLGLWSWHATRKYAFCLLAVMVLVNGILFYPRVNFRKVPYAELKPTSDIARVQKLMKKDTLYRVTGLDVAQLHQYDVYEAQKFETMLPNMSQYYRLEGIESFNPLLLADYVHFFERFNTRRMGEFDHEILNLDHADSLFMNMLSVKYLIGNPYEHSYSREFKAVSPGKELMITDFDQPAVLSQISLLNAVDVIKPVSKGDLLAEMKVRTDERVYFFPIRYLEHAGPVFLSEKMMPSVKKMKAKIRNQWPRDKGWMVNYYANFALPKPLAVKSISLIAKKNPFLCYSLMLTEPENGDFKNVKGSGLYENPFAWPKLYFPDEIKNYVKDQELDQMISNRLEWYQRDRKYAFIQQKEYGAAPGKMTLDYKNAQINAGLFQIDAELSKPWLLATSIPWHPEWQVLIDGKRANVLKANAAFVGAEIPAGKHQIIIRFRPNLWYLSLGLYFALLGFMVWKIRKPRMQVEEQ